MHFWRKDAMRWLCAVVLLALAGCVTTQTGGFTEKKDPKKAVQLSIQAARDYIRDGNWEAAKRHLKTALSIDDDNAEAHESLAQVFWMTGEVEQADKEFRRAIDLGRNDSRARNNYAAFLYSQKRYKDAERQLEEVTEDLLYDQRPLAFLNLGRTRLKLKQYKEAAAALERAHLMEPHNPQTTFYLAEADFQLGKFPESQALFDSFRNSVKQLNAPALWLGIRLADKFGDRNAKASYALALRNLYPRSDEYLEYESVYGHDGAR